MAMGPGASSRVLLSQLVSQLVSQSVSQLVSQSLSQSVSQSVIPSVRNPPLLAPGANYIRTWGVLNLLFAH